MQPLITPSEALQGSFVLPQTDDVHAQITQVEASSFFVTYAVMVGNLGLLLPRGTVSMIVEAPLAFCRLPNTPAWFQGMANYFGDFLPVFDLEALLEFPSTTHHAKLLIIGEGEKSVGITVSEPPFRLRLSTSDVMTGRPPLPPVISPYVRACYKSDRVWVDWDVEAFFSSVGRRI